MQIEIESRLDDGVVVYFTKIGGRKVRVRSRGGIKRAEQIFAMIGNGVRQSAAHEFALDCSDHALT
jgi:hypothetical protein